MEYFIQIFEQSLLFFPLILGIYITFNVLSLTDLSVDGVFVFGAAFFARFIEIGFSPILAFVASILLSGCAGIFLALIQRNNKIESLISGILLSFILNSLSLVIMNRPNISLLNKPFLCVKENFLLFLIILILGLFLFLGIFLKSFLGLKLKAFGNNQSLLSLLKFNKENYRMLGLFMSSSLVGLSGVLTAQRSGFSDVNMGFGQALIGIAIILLSKEFLITLKIKSNNDFIKILFSFFSTFFYFLLISEIIRLGLNTNYLKIVIGGFLIFFLYLSGSNKKVQL